MKIPNDKILHFVVGHLACDICLFFDMPILVALALVTLMGAGKEIYDRVSKKGNPELADFGVTVLGGFTSIVLNG